MLGSVKSIAVPVVVGLGLVATLATGVSFAASSDSGVKACVNSHDVLALRTKNDHCPSGYGKTALGARGPRGEAGAPGHKGDTGPAGVIDARYFAGTAAMILPDDDSATTVGNIDDLAAGHWFISASLTASDPADQGTSLHLVCHLYLSVGNPADDLSDPSAGLIIQDISGSEVASLSTQNAFDTTAVSNVHLDCDSAGSPTLDNIRIMAVPVSSYR